MRHASLRILDPPPRPGRSQRGRGPGTAALTSCGDSAPGSKDGGGTVVERSHIQAAQSGGRRLVGAAHSTPDCW
ncbi:hypothetical protein ACFC18_54795 [Streptomyces sp. NPDC056121]|uniref:hypothetical protein n=1 Tax=Streptomyces TaxID=1883 RepID=UPI001D0A01F7|nr:MULTISPECIES: hypothetical protein [Streptomyces]MCX5084193.1 hypothetical protein [Streptomyces sp. NBC_00401]UDM04480.1 hypothetical protein LGI35_42605 [Streptomyces longhuiensis]